ncbi:MAG TPA: hypothetical protein VLH39_07340, partial [Magnetospirillaceae bacterium]|nr:hypothetical protein [Magnetospirillaceae bacterium]
SNPFSIGTAQKLAGLPVFSGAPFRIMILALCYALLVGFLIRHAKRVEALGGGCAAPEDGEALDGPGPDLPPESLRGARVFGWAMAGLLAVVLTVTLVPGLSGYSMPIMGLAFLLAGMASSLSAGLSGRAWLSAFTTGILGILPAGILILMALSVRHIISEGGILDTILAAAADAVAGASPYGAAAFIYILTLGLNFFIASASAKAFLLMPLLAPLADLTGIPRQVAVQAFVFGDGFSNMLYPTNAVLLISLSLAGISWTRYARWVLPLQAAVLVLTMGLLMLAVAVGYS